MPLHETQLWDGRIVVCDGFRDGLPYWGYNHAPTGLVTKSQLWEQKLRRRRGQDPVGLLVFHRRGAGEQVGELFRIDQALPSRRMSPRWADNIARMHLAHRTCRCGHVAERYLPTSTWTCSPCAAATGNYGERGASRRPDPHPAAPTATRRHATRSRTPPHPRSGKDRTPVTSIDTSSEITRENADVGAALDHEREQLRTQLQQTTDPAARAEILRRAITNLQREALVWERMPGRTRTKQAPMAANRRSAAVAAAGVELEQLREHAARHRRELPDPLPLLGDLEHRPVSEHTFPTLIALYTAAAGTE
ncbi:RRQRL motif-containing zinc-binding protein [Amycolatopsis sp. NPDC023774]|uniref:RRQRL motif-containing zinc-binding protein n=1 Tax=Amycolatopsis sp. NPDC023774 TaxID=3155015 RepID=UPI0034092432